MRELLLVLLLKWALSVHAHLVPQPCRRRRAVLASLDACNPGKRAPIFSC
jgi:hypothetical protein